MKKAFTMLELVMVMVIMGIVASIGADIIASMYSNYLRSRTINRLESQTEITLEQIIKRLQYRIKDSAITRKSTGEYLPLSQYETTDGNYTVLEWIGYSNESFLGTPRPGWSGFIDIDHNDTNKSSKTIKTSESNLTLASNIIDALSYEDVNLSTGKEAVIIFKGKASNADDFGWKSNASGAKNSDGNSTIKVRIKTGTIDVFDLSAENTSDLPDDIYEQYDLAHTAYAIVPEGNSTNDFNLTLKYNYQPWDDENYGDGNSSVLAEHASLFRFKQEQSVIQVKLCLHDSNETGVGDMIVVCKEKVVF